MKLCCLNRGTVKNEIWMFDFKLNFELENCENQFELENCYVKTRTSQMFAHAQV